RPKGRGLLRRATDSADAVHSARTQEVVLAVEQTGGRLPNLLRQDHQSHGMERSSRGVEGLRRFGQTVQPAVAPPDVSRAVARARHEGIGCRSADAGVGRVLGCLSRMRRKSHVRFLGGRVAARPPSHPTTDEGSIPFTRSMASPPWPAAPYRHPSERADTDDGSDHSESARAGADHAGSDRTGLARTQLGIAQLKAKLDTGARSSALHVETLDSFLRDGAVWLRFTVRAGRHPADAVHCEARALDRRVVTDTGGHRTERWFIRSEILLAGRRFEADINLTDRQHMLFPMLLG